MKPTRKKRRRIAVSSPVTEQAPARPLATTPAVRTRIEPGDPAERLAYALIQRHLRHRGIDASVTERAIKGRIDRARDELSAHEGGAAEARYVTTGLTSNGGALLRTVETAAPDARQFAARAAVRFVAYVREHKAESTPALVLLASSAQWSVLGEMLRDRAFAGSAGPLTSSASRKADTTTISKTVGGLGDWLKLAYLASNAARGDLREARAEEARALEAKKPLWSGFVSPIPRPAIAPTDVTPGEPDEDEATDHEGNHEEPAESIVTAGMGSRGDDDDEATLKPGFESLARPPPTKPVATPAPPIFHPQLGYMRADQLPRPVSQGPTAEQIARARARSTRASEDLPDELSHLRRPR